MNQRQPVLDTPVLFLIFNRPLETKQVFEEIRKAKPTRIYIAADGARDGCPDDFDLCEEARSICEQVDWDCKLQTLFRDTNIGCMRAVIESIDWFFDNESMGIILEDDCVPNQSFFSYASGALKKFWDDARVWHICGNNFHADPKIFRGSDYGFSPLSQVWGWATWGDRWKKAEFNPWYLGELVEKEWNHWRFSENAKKIKLHDLEVVKEKASTWDFMWQINVLCHDGLAVYPKVNLISNIGVGEKATHTKENDANRNHLPTYKIECDFHDDLVENNSALTEFLELRMGLKNKKVLAKIIWISSRRRFRSFLKMLLRRFLLRHSFAPVVVASTGRAGSTMLFNSLVEGAAASHGNWLGSRFTKLLSRCMAMGIWRLEGEALPRDCVIKTHDVPPINFGPQETKFIFVYGDPLESAISVKKMADKNGLSWFYEHVYHLCGHGDMKDLFNTDCLNYKNQMESWLKCNFGENLIIVRYEDLWGKKESIEAHVGFEIELPHRKARESSDFEEPFDQDMFNALSGLGEGRPT